MKGKQKCGLMVVLSIARHFPDPLDVPSCANEQGVSASYIEQVVQPLRRAGLVKGLRGPGGGYFLVRHPSTVSVADIVEAFKPFEVEDEYKDPRTRDAFRFLEGKQMELFGSITLDRLISEGG